MPYTPVNAQITYNGPEGVAPSLVYLAVTPHNSTDFDNLARALYIGGSGNVVAVGHDNVAVTFVGVPAGTVLPIRCRRVNATSTTATSIVALF